MTNELHPIAYDVLKWLDENLAKWPNDSDEFLSSGLPSGDEIVFDQPCQRIEIVSKGLVVGITKSMWDKRRGLLGDDND